MEKEKPFFGITASANCSDHSRFFLHPLPLRIGVNQRLGCFVTVCGLSKEFPRVSLSANDLLCVVEEKVASVAAAADFIDVRSVNPELEV